jgi:hypothetical protein
MKCNKTSYLSQSSCKTLECNVGAFQRHGSCIVLAASVSAHSKWKYLRSLPNRHGYCSDNDFNNAQLNVIPRSPAGSGMGLPFMLQLYSHLRQARFKRSNGKQGPSGSLGTAVGIANGHGMNILGVGVRFPIFPPYLSSPCRSDRLWGPFSLSNGYRRHFLAGVKRPGREPDHSPSTRAEIKIT